MDRLTNSGTKEARPDVTIREIMNKLAEYEDVEESGRLWKLPCAVGATVYSFSFGNVLELQVKGFIMDEKGVKARLFCETKKYGWGNDGFEVNFDIEDVGKKWFATQKEAEKAAKGN